MATLGRFSRGRDFTREHAGGGEVQGQLVRLERVRADFELDAASLVELFAATNDEARGLDRFGERHVDLEQVGLFIARDVPGDGLLRLRVHCVARDPDVAAQAFGFKYLLEDTARVALRAPVGHHGAAVREEHRAARRLQVVDADAPTDGENDEEGGEQLHRTRDAGIFGLGLFGLGFFCARHQVAMLFAARRLSAPGQSVKEWPSSEQRLDLAPTVSVVCWCAAARSRETDRRDRGTRRVSNAASRWFRRCGP